MMKGVKRMTKFSEAVLGTMMFIGLALVFLGMAVASESIAPSLMLFGAGGMLMGVGVLIASFFCK